MQVFFNTITAKRITTANETKVTKPNSGTDGTAVGLDLGAAMIVGCGVEVGIGVGVGVEGCGVKIVFLTIVLLHVEINSAPFVTCA